VTHTCEQCAGAFSRSRTSRDALRFCSKRCAGAWRTAQAIARRSAARQRQCLQCSMPFVGRGRLCSDTCRRRRATLAQTARTAAKKMRRPLSVCRHCQTPFRPPYGSKTVRFFGKYCSDQCRRTTIRKRQAALDKVRGCRGTHAHRAKHYGNPRDWTLTNLEVFERDGWLCQLCGRATPKRLRGTCDRRAPEVDHIIPLCAGGGHTRDNVQCACRECNGKKGAKPLGQLRLSV